MTSAGRAALARPLPLPAVTAQLLRLLLLTALAASVLVPWHAEARRVPASGDPLLGPLVSGTSTYVDGVFVWTDYAYDDRGADANGRPGGDTAYPATMSPNNVADLVQLQVGLSGRDLLLRAVLETLEPGSRPVVGVAVDRDGRSTTGAASLPGSWQPAAPLGVDRLYVLRSGSGEVLDATASGWRRTGRFRVASDPRANTLAATVAWAGAVPRQLRAVAVAGYAGADGRSWVEGATPVHDLAFVRGDTPGTEYVQSVADAVAAFAGADTGWQDHRQAAILAGDADPAPAVASIDTSALRRRATSRLPALRKGLHTFLYRSDLRLGEGVTGTGNTTLFAGPYQPYLVWVPGRPTAGLPLVVYLHGTGQSHTSAVNVAPYSPETHNAQLNLPDALFDLPAVVVWPLGRGPGQGYAGASEQDVLDVTDDVLARLALDPDRVMLAGLSMGGFGTFRLGSLYPDRWSLAYSDVGADTTGLVENLTALPVRMQNGAPDYLVHLYQPLQTRDKLEAAGSVDYASWILARKHHQPAFALAECVYRESFRRPRTRNPVRVRYTVDPAMFVDDSRTGLRLRYDGAYWVDGMRVAGPGRGGVDLTTHALPTRLAPGPLVREVRENARAPRDFCGTRTTVQTRDAWEAQERAVRQLSNLAPRPLVTGALSGLSAVTIAADRAGVARGTLRLTSDRVVALTLTGLRQGAVVSAGVTRVRARAGSATITLLAGTTVVAVR